MTISPNDDAAGAPLPAAVHRLPVRIYWEDTDAGGIVYHASHLRFFERGRTEYLRAQGIAQSALAAGADAVLFAVRRMEIDYLKPARLDDLLTVETQVTALSGPRVTMVQRLLRDDVLIATATVLVVAIGADGRPRRIPPAVAASLGHPVAAAQ